MAEGLVLRFKGVGEKEYRAVNKALGIDPETGSGDWPAGMISHTGGATDDGGLVVTELWESRDAQGKFMQGRLGKALGEGGISAMPEITWYHCVSDHRN
jgi:hypothetical protein